MCFYPYSKRLMESCKICSCTLETQWFYLKHVKCQKSHPNKWFFFEKLTKLDFTKTKKPPPKKYMYKNKWYTVLALIVIKVHFTGYSNHRKRRRPDKQRKQAECMELRQADRPLKGQQLETSSDGQKISDPKVW